MRGKKAKAIRRAVFGDKSLKAPRSYSVGLNGQVIVRGPRAVYQQVKRDYTRGLISGV